MTYYQNEEHFRMVGQSWRRIDPDGFGVWVVDKHDTSPAVLAITAIWDTHTRATRTTRNVWTLPAKTANTAEKMNQ